MNAPDRIAPMADGLCQCGCGAATRLAPMNDRSKGWVKGQPIRFIQGHVARVTFPKMAAESAGNKSTDKRGYVLVNLGGRRRQYEHILIAESALGRSLKTSGLPAAQREVVHHIDGNRSNNAPSNLLVCTAGYHQMLHALLERSPAWPEFAPRCRHPNGSGRIGKYGLKGVTKSRHGKWKSKIEVDGRMVSLGVFSSPEDAAAAYDRKATELHGPGWTTNKSMGLIG